MTDAEGITSKVESNLSEIRTRIDAERDHRSRSRTLFEVMEVLCTDFADMLEAVGWTERAHEISCVVAILDRFEAVQSLLATEGPQLARDAAAAGVGEQYAMTRSLIGELGTLAARVSR